MSDVYDDPDAPDRTVAQLVSVREFYTTKVQWVCIDCRISESEFVQPKCVRCGRLLQVAKP